MRQLWAETMYEAVYTKASSYHIGDVNTDGKVDISDISALQKYLVQAGELTAVQLQNAELSSDGSVNIFDLAALKRYVRTASETPDIPETPESTAAIIVRGISCNSHRLL